MTSPSTSARAAMLVALSAAGFAAIAIFVTLATQSGATLLTILSWRYIIGGGVLAAIGWWRGHIRAMDHRGWQVVAVGGIGQSIIAVVTLVALRYIPAATLAFLFYTYPAWVAIIARLRHSEPLTPLRLFALGLSLTGIFIMVGAPGAAALHPIGVSLALIAALLYAIYVPVIGTLQRGRSPIATATQMAAGAAIVLTSAAILRGELAVQLPAAAWLPILGLALISTVAAFLCFLSGLEVVGPLRTAIISTIEPFFTAVLGAWVLAQPITAATLVGGALIASAVILVQLPTSHANSGRS